MGMVINDILGLIVKVFEFSEKKKEKKKLKNKLANPKEWQRPFSRWTVEHHVQPGQDERYLRSFDESMEILWVSEDKYFSEIRGTQGIVYNTTIGSCSCPDYDERMLPCKHMYLLARHTGLI